MTTLAPPKTQVTTYAADVADGRSIAGRLVQQACIRHLRDLSDGQERGLHFDEDAAAKAIRFFKYLKHYKGEWAGKELTLEPWQEFIIGSLFGWLREDDLRRFRTAYVEIPRKNGKSLIAAGVGLYLAFFDGEGGAEVYSAATKRDQAKIVWGDAKTMVLASSELKQRIGITGGMTGVGNLYRLETNSKFLPLGADSDSMDGLNIHGVVVDELHAHKTRNMWDVLQTATGARRQPLTFAITTAGYDRHSICYEQHDYSTKILDRVYDDDTFFCYVASLDEGDDWADSDSWAKANPNYGISVKADDLERKAAKAKQLPGEQNEFLRKHLNVWTEQSTRWLDMAVWDENAGDLTHEEMREALKGRECWAGGDLSNRIDLTCVSLWFPSPDGSVDVLTFPFVPEENVRQRAERDRVPYDVWIEQGFIDATQGNVIDYDWIRKKLNDLADDYQIREIALDPWNATQLMIKLGEDGFNCVPIRQGFMSLTEPTKELEKLVVSRKLRHGGHPVLRWAASNVAVSTDPAGNIKPDKAKSTERIDPIASLVNAGARAIVHQNVEEWHGIYLGGDGEDE